MNAHIIKTMSKSKTTRAMADCHALDDTGREIDKRHYTEFARSIGNLSMNEQQVTHLLHKIVTVLVELHVESERVVGRTPKAVVLWIATPWVDDFLHHLSIA